MKGGVVKPAVSSYIVRVYYSEDKNTQKLIGLVEKAGREEKQVFHTLKELWDILSASTKKTGGKRHE